MLISCIVLVTSSIAEAASTLTFADSVDAAGRARVPERDSDLGVCDVPSRGIERVLTDRRRFRKLLSKVTIFGKRRSKRWRRQAVPSLPAR